MSLLDVITQLGRAVDRGEMTHAEAVEKLVEASDGGITTTGAEYALCTYGSAVPPLRLPGVFNRPSWWL